MARPKMKSNEKKKGISISLNVDLLKNVKKKVDNISSYIESLIIKDLKK